MMRASEKDKYSAAALLRVGEQGLPTIEQEMDALVHSRALPPAPPRRRVDPLDPKAAELISQSWLDAANTVANEAKQSADKYLAEAQACKEEAYRWADTLVAEAKNAADHIAGQHANFRGLAEKLRAIMRPAPESEEVRAGPPSPRAAYEEHTASNGAAAP